MPQINKVSESVSIADGDFTVASAGGDFFENDSRTALWIKNESVGDLPVTLVASGRCSHDFLHDQTVIVAAGSVLKTRTFPQGRFGSKTALAYPSGASGLAIVAVRQGSYVG